MRGLEIDPLIGREALLSEVQAKVGRYRLVTLTGPGGSGKTRLAEAVVEAARAEREALFVDLSTITEGERLGAALVEFLGLATEGDPDGAVRVWARSGERLLALDNLEQAQGIGVPVSRLLEEAPGLHVLATSRAPLGARGEHEVRIPPLGLPVGDGPEDVAASAAGALFLERARALGRLDGPVDPGVAADIARLCRRLDGLPLAIELAAARTRILSPGAILRRLDERDLAVLRRPGKPDRHGSLEAVLDWTLGLLAQDERDVLEAAAVCSGSFDLNLLRAIVDADDVLDITEALIAYGLFVVDEEIDGEPRFRLLETVRLGTLALLDEREDELRRRHAEAMLASAVTWGEGTHGPEMRRWLARFDADSPNLASALEWALNAAPPIAAELAFASVGYWAWRPSSDIEDRLSALLSRSRDPTRWRALASGALARLSINRTDDETRAVAHEAIDLGQLLGLRDVELEGLLTLGVALDEADEKDFSMIEGRMESQPPTGLRQRVVQVQWLALKVLPEHGLAGMSSVFESALPELRAIGCPGPIAIAVGNIALSHLTRGRIASATDRAAETAQLGADIGYPEFEVWGLSMLALAYREAGRIDEATNTMVRVLAIAAARTATFEDGRVLLTAAAFAAMAGRPIDAAWLAGAALATFDGVLHDEHQGVRQIKAARREATAVEWELAERDGRSAPLAVALDRALAVVTNAAKTPRNAAPRLRHGGLTPREVEILTLLGDGRSDIEIAGRLFISRKTASVHVANVKAKLGAASRLEIALRAREMGLVGSAAPLR